MRVSPNAVLVSELGRLHRLIGSLILVSCIVKHITLVGTANWTVTQLLLLLLMLLLLVLIIATTFEHIV